MEFLQSYTFTIKLKKGTNNKVLDALSKRLLTVQEFNLKIIGLDGFKNLYEEDIDFSEA